MAITPRNQTLAQAERKEALSAKKQRHDTRGADASLGIKSRIRPNTVKCPNLKSVMNRAKGGLRVQIYC